jgi:hypothetical protein
VQSNVLSRDTNAALRVLAVWVPFMSGTRSAINPSVFPGGNVTSLWDQNAISSQWFSQHVTHSGGPTWDYYLLFPARARWGAVPGPIVSQGGPVIVQGGALLSAVRPLLR